MHWAGGAGTSLRRTAGFLVVAQRSSRVRSRHRRGSIASLATSSTSARPSMRWRSSSAPGGPRRTRSASSARTS
eukprot:3810024-Lingulodinium_polyedra.AAC.1